MARGNDPDAARELKERYGTSGNAEDLINANRARRDPLVQTASRLTVDAEATSKLKVSDIDAPGEVLDAAVRGNYVSYVYLDETGRTQRGACVRSDLSKAEAKTAESQAALRESDVETAVAKAHAERDAELARVQAEYEQRLVDAVEKAKADAAKDAQKAAAKADDDAAKAAKAAAKDADKK